MLLLQRWCFLDRQFSVQTSREFTTESRSYFTFGPVTAVGWCCDVIRSQLAWSSSRRVWRSICGLSSGASSRRQRKTSAVCGGTGRSGWSSGRICTARRLCTLWRSSCHLIGHSLGLWCWTASYCDTPVNRPLYLREKHLTSRWIVEIPIFSTNTILCRLAVP